MKAKGHIPIRTCISCGSKRPKKELVRLIPDNDNRIIRDNSGRIKGRGAYICDTRSCLERLLKSKRINRQFRTDRDIYLSEELSDLSFDNNKSLPGHTMQR